MTTYLGKSCSFGLPRVPFRKLPFQGGTSAVVPYCYLFLYLYFGSAIMLMSYFVNFR